MFFLTKKRTDEIAKAIEHSNENGYWAIVRKQFFKNRLAVWSLRVFYVILFVAITADFIANERPVYCSIKMEQTPDTLDTKIDIQVKVDTLLLASTTTPSKKEASKIEKELDEGRMECKVTETKIKTRTSFKKLMPVSESLSSDSIVQQKFLQIDTIITYTTLSSIDTIVETYFPIFRQYLVDLGLATWNEKFVTTKWLEQKYESVLFAPITYSATTRDPKNNKFKSPLGEQNFPEDSNNGWHYLGTERIGQDVAAGMIHGTRTAMLVGLVAMSIATFIGLFFGAISGYFGDERLKVSRIRIALNLIAVVLAIFFAFISNGYIIADLIGEGKLLRAIGVIIGWFVALVGLANILAIPLKKIPVLGKKVTVALDIIVMRFIEVVNSIPLLILILAIVAIIEKPSVLFVMVIIGTVSWTGIAKFIRAELLRIRRLEYIEAAQAFGYSEFRIILRHALPNALAPVLIAIAFGVATAILTEAFLSFIGVGIPDDQVTWGSLLRLSQDKFSAWWLAIFPGFAIFITVTIFNLIGEGLTEALDPRLRE
ncbi:ABC transporter permease [Aureispira anguillae]|uniref:ABC transporter permease n=1 Tax=Aureispira anguillae TaxID=2864201 RepID=A0A915YIS4_9BACT|nr:ABC transporter permease [Aureispira anguillae]BDS13623.1 ABC transporter permease [Aureispira anguillae]